MVLKLKANDIVKVQGMTYPEDYDDWDYNDSLGIIALISERGLYRVYFTTDYPMYIEKEYLIKATKGERFLYNMFGSDALIEDIKTHWLGE